MNSKSCRSFVFCIVVSLTFLIESCVSASLEEEKDEDYLNELTEEDEERFLIIPAISINASALSSYLPIALALAASVASLLATVALAAIVFSVFGKYKHDGYGSYSGYGNTGGYTSYNSASSYRSLFDPSMIDWEKFSILDLIKTGEEIWSQFNPSDVECQKRLICEIHQNSGDLGSTAEQIVDLFSYLSYKKL
ncbi:hypothetical protein Avbf_13242 [Armadillidium vulgare]|nr:hypothetical protein Avbf_13242 [Armadillidium vulgare]